ncbi:tRNA lysidine(34) synthetase [Anaerolentibacter hominis]|uniref:tRNA lysidine(34) synthetase n=1 Tax=Anaerolentibacter hominis TaxID=3079009 RepID=UPI0031B8A01C
MKLQRLLSLTRCAVDDFQMIQAGDKIAVGISGGKDSLTLLHALSGLKRFYPNSFELVAIAVHLGFEGLDLAPVAALCEELQVPFYVVETQIASIVFERRQESNPCSLCAKMRKGAFNRRAVELGCNKIAYAHHMDDMVETMLMSMIFEGRFHTYSPVTYLDRMDITLIRPLFYLHETDIINFKKNYQLPVQKNPCPVDGHTKREYIKELVKRLEAENPGTRERIFHGILDTYKPVWEEKRESIGTELS